MLRYTCICIYTYIQYMCVYCTYILCMYVYMYMHACVYVYVVCGMCTCMCVGYVYIYIQYTYLLCSDLYLLAPKPCSVQERVSNMERTAWVVLSCSGFRIHAPVSNLPIPLPSVILQKEQRFSVVQLQRIQIKVTWLIASSIDSQNHDLRYRRHHYQSDQPFLIAAWFGPE